MMGGALSVLGAPKKVASRKKFAKKNGSKQELGGGGKVKQLEPLKNRLRVVKNRC